MWREGVVLGWALGCVVACSTSGSGGNGSGTDDGGSLADSGAGGAASGGSTSAGGSSPGNDATASGNGGAAPEAGSGVDSGSSGGASGSTGAGGTTGAGGLGTGGTTDVPTTRKLDLLLVIDNSISMADKQAVLKSTVPDLVREVTDPALRVADLHVGVITSSLGSLNSGACDATATSELEQKNDLAHLLGTRPRAAALGVPDGFMAWTPTDSVTDLTSGVQSLVEVAGEFGCGWEMTLESVYRFLADPNPPLTVNIAPCTTGGTASCAFPTGTDDELLRQRAAFLRPDSAVAVVILTDENDCSVRNTAQYYLAVQSNFTMFRGSSACATNPNDPCCYSCASAPPQGCTQDPICQTPTLPAQDDTLNLRCFEQKRRFGFDFLYPTARYVNALRNTSLCTSRADLDASQSCPDTDGDGAPDIVQNPLFLPETDGGPARDPSMVYALGIVGVPWQTIQETTDSSGNPLPSTALVYPTASAFESRGLWPVVLGDSSASPPVPPSDPLMIESMDPRTGVTPGTGESLAPPSAGYLANTVNGHEWNNLARDDLQFSCIFPLAQTRDCSALLLLNPSPGCDCFTPNQGDYIPLCQAPDGTYSTQQGFAKAYPGLRHLAVLRGLGDNAAVASICARNLTDATKDDYGYRPAVAALATALRKTVQ